jgi:hypothetical protein
MPNTAVARQSDGMRNAGAIGTLLLAAMLGATAAQAADTDLSLCLNAATTLEAGGDVSDKDLAAAQHACERARQTTSDESVRRHVAAAYVTVDDETRKRQAAHRPH